MKLPLFLAALACASTVSAAPKIGGSVSADYVSAYTFRGIKLANDSFQPAINVTYGEPSEEVVGGGAANGGSTPAKTYSPYGTVWANRPFSSALNSEIDFTAGVVAPCGIDVGATAYTYPGSAQTTWEPYIGYSLEFARTKASVYAYRDLTLLVTTIEGKVSQTLVTVGDATCTADGTFGVSSNSQQSYSYWAVGPTIQYSVTKAISVVGAVQYVSTDDIEVGRDILAGRLGFAYSF